jgi:hypothetical protein
MLIKKLKTDCIALPNSQLLVQVATLI